MSNNIGAEQMALAQIGQRDGNIKKTEAAKSITLL